MARERELPVGRKYANAIVSKRIRWRQDECGLAEVRPIGERCHLRVGEYIGVDDDRQRIASQGLRGEHVDLSKYEFSHLAALPCWYVRPCRIWHITSRGGGSAQPGAEERRATARHTTAPASPVPRRHVRRMRRPVGTYAEEPIVCGDLGVAVSAL